MRGKKFARCEAPEVSKPQNQNDKRPTNLDVFDSTVPLLVPKLPWAHQPQFIGAEEIIVDSFFAAFHTVGVTAERPFDTNLKTEARTLYCYADAAEVSPLFMVGVLPHMSRKHHEY